MDGSIPNLRLQIADLLDGTMNLDQFQEWIAFSETTIELHGSDADVDLLDRVTNLLAEYTGGHISAPAVLQILRAESPRDSDRWAPSLRTSA